MITKLLLAGALGALSQSACVHKDANVRQEFRDYGNAKDHVKRFYKDQHEKQTYAFATTQLNQISTIFSNLENKTEAEILQLEKEGKIRRLSIWDAIKELDQLKDESDPDFDLPNSIHLLQTAEAMRKSVNEISARHQVPIDSLDWFILVGLMHDIGKLDALLRKVPQWAVVGDTFPVGCRFSDKNIFAGYFTANADAQDPRYQSEMGIYPQNVGLNNVVMSYGHDEFAYQVLKRQGTLPESALYMIRFHSFYPLHQEGAYRHLLAPEDHRQLPWIKEFSQFDLYSKDQSRPELAELAPFYQKLINKYFPPNAGESEKKLIWPVLSSVD